MTAKGSDSNFLVDAIEGMTPDDDAFYSELLAAERESFAEVCDAMAKPAEPNKALMKLVREVERFTSERLRATLSIKRGSFPGGENA